MYQKMIKEKLTAIGYFEIDPRHIEGYMRLEHGTLDGLSKKQFDSEIIMGIECIRADGKENAESLAKSFGL